MTRNSIIHYNSATYAYASIFTYMERMVSILHFRVFTFIVRIFYVGCILCTISDTEAFVTPMVHRIHPTPSAVRFVEFEIIGDVNKTYVSARLFHSKYTKPIHLEEFSNLNDSGLLTLKRYYSNLKSGDVNKIKNQFFQLDGSYSKINDLVKKNPSMFSKYLQLDKVEVLSKSLWGRYNIYSVRLHARGKTMDWREELICQKESCFITRSLDASKSKEELFEAAHYFLTKRFQPFSILRKGQVEKSKQSGLSILPSYNFSNTEGSEYTLSFGIYPDIYPNNTYDFSLDKWVLNTKKLYSELDVIVTMLSEIKNSKIENNYYSLLIPIINKYWLNTVDNDFIIPLNRIKLNENNKTKIVSKDYLLAAFYQTIQNWTAIKPIGKLVSDETTYIIVEVEGENSTSTMQVFSLSRKNGRYWMLLNNDDDTSAVMSNKAFIKLLFRWMQNRFK